MDYGQVEADMANQKRVLRHRPLVQSVDLQCQELLAHTTAIGLWIEIEVANDS